MESSGIQSNLRMWYGHSSISSEATAIRWYALTRFSFDEPVLNVNSERNHVNKVSGTHLERSDYLNNGNHHTNASSDPSWASCVKEKLTSIWITRWWPIAPHARIPSLKFSTYPELVYVVDRFVVVMWWDVCSLWLSVFVIQLYFDRISLKALLFGLTAWKP